jgi:hypothetical protein
LVKVLLMPQLRGNFARAGKTSCPLAVLAETFFPLGFKPLTVVDTIYRC